MDAVRHVLVSITVEMLDYFVNNNNMKQIRVRFRYFC